jgi:signal transduction histidine kinase
VTEAVAHDGFRELCHDARQSVATIMLLARAGEAEVDDRDLVLKRLAQIAGQTRWMASLLDDLLGADGDLGVVDVAEELEQAIALATAGFTGTLRLMMVERPRALTAPLALRRAFANVVDNAVRAAGSDGCVQIKLTTGGRAAVVEIEDDGPGFGRIPAVHGIGLAASRRAVESLGGSLLTGTGSLGGALVRLTLPSIDGPEGPPC